MPSKFFNVLIIVSFVCSLVTPIPKAHADNLLGLPEPGMMVNLSPTYEPILIKGLKVHPENPFLFDFIIDTGTDSLSKQQKQLKQESSKLIKYFLAAMTIPEKDLWVNLSPYEKNRMIASNLAQTEMGRDMLAQDYILKQLTASLIYPEKNLGKTFWDEVYSKAQELYGTTQVPVNTFNKVWIVADRADVYERGNVAYVVGAHLKVMLEEDYLARQKHTVIRNNIDSVGSNIVRSIILPQIEKEVNQGRNFAPLRQMFYSMILASWYKTALKNAILTQIYGNQSKVKVGINQADLKTNEEIFNRYLRAYKKGVFNYIKEDIDKISQQSIPRKYFSGGEDIWEGITPSVVENVDASMLDSPGHEFIATVDAFPARVDSALIGGTKAKAKVLGMFKGLKTIEKEDVFDLRLEGLRGSLFSKFLKWYYLEKDRESILEAMAREAKEEFVGQESTARLLDKLPESWPKSVSESKVLIRKIIRILGNGIPKVRISYIVDTDLTNKEQGQIIDRIAQDQNKHAIALTEEAIVKAIKGNGKIVLDKTMGYFHESLLGKEIDVSKNIAELFENTASDSLNENSGVVAKLAFSTISQSSQPTTPTPSADVDHLIRGVLLQGGFIDIRGRISKQFYNMNRVDFIKALPKAWNLKMKSQIYDILQKAQLKNLEEIQIRIGVFFKMSLKKDKQKCYVLELSQEDPENLDSFTAKPFGGAVQFKDQAMDTLAPPRKFKKGLVLKLGVQEDGPEIGQKMKIYNRPLMLDDSPTRTQLKRLLRWAHLDGVYFKEARLIFTSEGGDILNATIGLFVRTVIKQKFSDAQWQELISNGYIVPMVVVENGIKVEYGVIQDKFYGLKGKDGSNMVLPTMSDVEKKQMYPILLEAPCNMNFPVGIIGLNNGEYILWRFIFMAAIYHVKVPLSDSLERHVNVIRIIPRINLRNGTVAIFFDREFNTVPTTRVKDRDYSSSYDDEKLSRMAAQRKKAGKDGAMLDPGGIDFNSRNMKMNIQKGDKGISMNFDSAMIARIKTEGFDGLEFKIRSIVPLTNLPVFLSLESDIPYHQVLN